MNLQASSFEKIADGRKMVEVRLRDAKRQELRIGDTIAFVNRDNDDVVIADVAQLIASPSFKELFIEIGPAAIGDESVDDYRKLYDHYAPDAEARFGALGIRIANVRRT